MKPFHFALLSAYNSRALGRRVHMPCVSASRPQSVVAVFVGEKKNRGRSFALFIRLRYVNFFYSGEVVDVSTEGEYHSIIVAI